MAVLLYYQALKGKLEKAVEREVWNGAGGRDSLVWTMQKGFIGMHDYVKALEFLKRMIKVNINLKSVTKDKVLELKAQKINMDKLYDRCDRVYLNLQIRKERLRIS